MKQHTFSTELAYLVGIFSLALGTSFMVRADFGVAMVVAPAYLLHLKLSQVWSFFSFGVAEYTLQAVLLLAMMLLLRKAKLSYLFSFVTAVFYGILLDAVTLLADRIPADAFSVRVMLYAGGMLLCTMGVSLLFHTYIPPEAYELFVKEISAKYHADITRFKTAYDCVSCLVAILLSFLFFGFGRFEGIGWGTVICAIINGWLIGRWSKFFEKRLNFADKLPWRKYF